MSKNNTPTADALVAELAGVTDWPKMARAFAGAIGTIRSHERERAALLCKIAELERRLALRRQVTAA